MSEYDKYCWWSLLVKAGLPIDYSKFCDTIDRLVAA